MKKKDIPRPEPEFDPWKEKLQASLKNERPSPRRWGFWLGIVFLAFAALLVWWMIPRTPPALPPLVAFDALILKGEEAPVRAQFAATEEQPAPGAGREIVFQESRFPPPGQTLSRAKAKLDEEHVARASLKIPLELEQVAFEAECPKRDRQAGVKDQAHIFNLPGPTPLLVVSVEGTLSRASLDDWKKNNARDVVAVPEATPALRDAARQGLRIVYLALETDEPLLYQKMRSWTRGRFGAADTSLPEGPILARPEYPGDAAAAYADVLGKMKATFQGKQVAVTARPAIAERFRTAGWRTILIGDGEPLPGIERVRNWEDLGGAIGARP